MPLSKWDNILANTMRGELFQEILSPSLPFRDRKQERAYDAKIKGRNGSYEQSRNRCRQCSRGEALYQGCQDCHSIEKMLARWQISSAAGSEESDFAGDSLARG
jgi:ribosomal protein S14